MGGWSVGGRSIDLATLWPHVSVGPALAVHSNSGARSDRTRLPSHQQHFDLPRYSTVQVQSQPWGGHWLNLQIANQSCRKRKMQTFLSFFNHLIFHTTRFWTIGGNIGVILCHVKENLWCKCLNVIENASSTEYSAETKHDKNMKHKFYDIIFMFWCNQMIRSEFTFEGLGVRW
jgi:hypothetical protein